MQCPKDNAEALRTNNRNISVFTHKNAALLMARQCRPHSEFSDTAILSCRLLVPRRCLGDANASAIPRPHPGFCGHRVFVPMVTYAGDTQGRRERVDGIRRWLNHQKLKQSIGPFASSIMIYCVRSRSKGAQKDSVIEMRRAPAQLWRGVDRRKSERSSRTLDGTRRPGQLARKPKGPADDLAVRHPVPRSLAPTPSLSRAKYP